MFRGLILILFYFSWSQAQTCSIWSEARVLGYLDTNLLPEASGLSQSQMFPERFYHHNDSSRSFQVFLSTEQGHITDTLDLGIALRDVEDIDVGPCPQGSCVYLGDIGDNLRQRTNLELYIFPEQETYAQPLSVKKIYLEYPDAAHDAESLAVHPDGTLYLLTKASFNLFRSEPARLYRLGKSVWDLEDQDRVRLEFVQSLDLFALSGRSFDVFSHLATSMDFSNDARYLMVLSYGDAYEFDFERLLAGEYSYEKLLLDRSLQQEALSYTADGGFLYTAEANASQAPVKKVDCLSP